MTRAATQRLVFAAILMLAVVLGSRDITDEDSGMITGDMARYVMNGVFVHDLLASGGLWTFDDLASYAERYYARYPALSLGHHPPLLYVALAPFFAVFGVKLFSARLAAVAFFALAVWMLYSVARRLYDWRVASWVALLFATNLFVLRFGQYVLSEMPMIAVTLAAINVLLVYCESGRVKHFAAFVVLAAAGLYAKQLAVFVFPVYVVILVSKRGWRSLVQRHVLLLTAAGAVLIAPLLAVTLMLSRANVDFALFNAASVATGAPSAGAIAIIRSLLEMHLTVPVLVLAVGGAVVGIAKRDQRVLIPLVWLAGVLGGTVLFVGPVQAARYAFGAMPAYFLLAGSLSGQLGFQAGRLVSTLALAGAVGWQLWGSWNVRPVGTGGYETVAKYVVEHATTPVLFDSSIDSGSFVFFVRKHDRSGQIPILRSDKVFTVPARERRDVKTRISGAEGIYPVLQRFGIRYIVVDTRPPRFESQRWLRETLLTGRFIERQRVPMTSRQDEARGVDLVVYEFKDAGPPDLEAELDIGLPLAGRGIRLRLGDIIGGRKD